MRDQPVQHVMRVLPDGLGHDQRRLGVDSGEDLHPFLLRADEAMPFVGLERMGADQLAAEAGDGAAQRLLHLLLRRPAALVGGGPQIAVGDEQHLIGFDLRPGPDGG